MNNVEWYVSKGISKPMAEYFACGRKKIISVVPKENFTLIISFDNGEKRILDIKPMIKPNTVFENFSDYENFKRVYVDSDNAICWDIDPNVDSNVVWNNKVDLCPDACYVDSIPIV